jgi:hypothetical protein
MKIRYSPTNGLLLAATLLATPATFWKLAQSPHAPVPYIEHPAMEAKSNPPPSVAVPPAGPVTSPVQDLADFEEDMDLVFATCPGTQLKRLKQIVAEQPTERATYVLDHLITNASLSPTEKGDLIQAAMRHPSQEIRIRALESIDAEVAAHVEPAFQAALNDAAAGVQLQALGALESMPPAQRMQGYRESAASPFEEVQLALVTLLSNEGNPEAHALLTSLTQAESARVRHAAEFESRYLVDADGLVQDVVTQIAARKGSAEKGSQK